MSSYESWKSTEFDMKQFQDIEVDEIKYYSQKWQCSNGDDLGCIARALCSWSSHREVNSATSLPMIYNHKLGKLFTTWADKIYLGTDRIWFDENNPNILYWLFDLNRKVHLYTLDVGKGYK